MKKVMLIDDQEMANFIMKKMINVHLGDMAVYDFVLPQKAFEALRELEPDLILLDLNMPEMDGWAFLDAMQLENLNYPVAILTSSTSNHDLKRSKLYPNVVEFYNKPLPPAVIKGMGEILATAS